MEGLVASCGVVGTLLARAFDSLPHTGHHLLSGRLGWIPGEEGVATERLEVLVNEVRSILRLISTTKNSIDLTLALLSTIFSELLSHNSLSIQLLGHLSLLFLIESGRAVRVDLVLFLRKRITGQRAISRASDWVSTVSSSCLTRGLLGALTGRLLRCEPLICILAEGGDFARSSHALHSCLLEYFWGERLVGLCTMLQDSGADLLVSILLISNFGPVDWLIFAFGEVNDSELGLIPQLSHSPLQIVLVIFQEDLLSQLVAVWELENLSVQVLLLLWNE